MFASVRFLITVGLLATAALAAPAPGTPESSGSVFGDALELYTSCTSGTQDTIVCLKLRALEFVDRAARSADITIVDGLKVVQTEEAKANSRTDAGRSLNDIEATLPADPAAKEAAVDEAILDRAGKFLTTHTVELSLPEEVSRSFDEARGKKKKIVKTLLPLLLLGGLKAGILFKLALAGLALLAFKALIVGKIALIISAILGAQKLLASKGQQSYEVVAHPVHSHEDYHDHHSEHGHGWARSAGADLAYNAYKPAN